MRYLGGIGTVFSSFIIRSNWIESIGRKVKDVDIIPRTLSVAPAARALTVVILVFCAYFYVLRN